MILTDGLVLQDEKIWENFLKKEIIPENKKVIRFYDFDGNLIEVGTPME